LKAAAAWTRQTACAAITGIGEIQVGHVSGSWNMPLAIAVRRKEIGKQRPDVVTMSSPARSGNCLLWLLQHHIVVAVDGPGLHHQPTPRGRT
jgi:hypothetical protein